MKNILIPTDFSSNAFQAIDYAVNLYGKDLNCFHLLYAYALPIVTSEVAYAPIESQKEEATEKLNVAAEQVKKHFPNIDVKTHVEYGDLPTVIKRLENSEPIDAIVMGTTGSHGVREFLFGSNTYDVIDNTELPVYVVPNGVAIISPSKILLSTDFKPVNRVDLFDELKWIGVKHNAELTILNVKSVSDTYSMNEQLNFFDETFDTIPSRICVDDSEKVIDGIQKYIDDESPDLLVAVKRKKNFLKEMFGKSLTRDITFHLHLPMLILHD